MDYTTRLVRATRESSDLALGSSVRGAITLLLASKALAAVRGRDYVVPDDVRSWPARAPPSGAPTAGGRNPGTDRRRRRRTSLRRAGSAALDDPHAAAAGAAPGAGGAAGVGDPRARPPAPGRGGVAAGAGPRRCGVAAAGGRAGPSRCAAATSHASPWAPRTRSGWTSTAGPAGARRDAARRDAGELPRQRPVSPGHGARRR